MNLDVKHVEYGLVLAIIVILMFIFREEEKEVKVYKPEISEQVFDSHPLVAWSAVDKIGDVWKIRYRVTNHNTKLWIYDVVTGKLVHEQPYTRDPSLEDGGYRDFTYTWKLYKTEWTIDIPSGQYEIVVGGNNEPYNSNGKLSLVIEL